MYQRRGILLRVALLTSEAVPYAKTGGLGDVSGALPKALNASKEADACIILPLYDETKRELLREQPVFENLDVEWLGGVRRTWVWYSEAAGAPSFFIDAPEYFMRGGIYGFRDDHERFAFFCRAALALMGR
ncbi:MAG TPA: glycogen/starch synthase, partial [Pyrinomonadaceae bacterium]|nr:glycogen/starch synthase [Pyrinomonadaceae bacterium]